MSRTIMSLVMAILAGGLPGGCSAPAPGPVEAGTRQADLPNAESPPPLPADGWLTGTPEEKFAQIERHLRGLDVAMAEIGYRYGELLRAGASRNWEYAQYQTEKIDLSLRLAIERRPPRAKSSQPFIEADLPRLLAAIRERDGAKLDAALDRLHESCIECHKSENVLHFREAVERIRDSAR